MGRRLDANNLTDQLNKTPSLEPLYLVSGDEPLLIIEACDTLRSAARQAGYTERVSLVMDARSDWSTLIAATQNVSLFGDKRLVEVSLPSGKPGKTGSDTLLKLADMARTQALADTM